MGKNGIIAFAFGLPAEIEPNKRIAKMAIDAAGKLDAPIYTQVDVSSGIEANGIDIVTIEQSGEPPSTLTIARGAVRWALECDLTDLRVVAAVPHLPRAVRDVRMAIREVAGRMELHTVGEPDEGTDWFDPNSMQFRTRSRVVWCIRERILMALPFFLYERVAG